MLGPLAKSRGSSGPPPRPPLLLKKDGQPARWEVGPCLREALGLPVELQKNPKTLEDHT